LQQVRWQRAIFQADSRGSLGYTEPDPRDDLSGIDVARKLVILAREAGWKLSLEDVQVQNLVTPEFSTMPLPQFMESLDRLDASMSLLLESARSSGKIIRHVASLDSSGRAHVALMALPLDHAFAHTWLAVFTGWALPAPGLLPLSELRSYTILPYSSSNSWK